MVHSISAGPTGGVGSHAELIALWYGGRTSERTPGAWGFFSRALQIFRGLRKVNVLLYEGRIIPALFSSRSLEIIS